MNYARDLIKFSVVNLLIFVPLFTTQKRVLPILLCVVSNYTHLIIIGSAYLRPNTDL